MFLERLSCTREGDIIGVNVTYINYLDSIFGHDQFVFTAQPAVCHDGVYRSICDVNWNQENADMYCRSNLIPIPVSGILGECFFF